ncbi:hypothetical protein SAY87_023461 [Trapa incisa]|uniref:EF-hand domain-containing protein n=1 Tax=Trapa incisa TaxID=236973 RepID=A0AAN7KYS2_9MYRT|nr:hypothetical protein SAY87_023461 [Trapa incisa]
MTTPPPPPKIILVHSRTSVGWKIRNSGRSSTSSTPTARQDLHLGALAGPLLLRLQVLLYRPQSHNGGDRLRRNGLISTKELHMVMSRLNMKCTIEDCGRMVNSVDSDGDGNVNLEEFKKMMTATITRCRWQWSMDPTIRECVMSTIIGGGGDEEKEQ